MLYYLRGDAMTTDAQKRARDKWNKENMTVQVCNVTKTKKQAFKDACTRAGTNPNAVRNNQIY